MSSPAPRQPAIDSLKGTACVAIIWHHLAFYGPMSDVALPLFPHLIAWLYDYGRMAVQVFLVLGGYLAAKSLAPQGMARFASGRQQIGRRFVRLIVPYGAALLIALLVAAAVRPWLSHDSVPAEPDWAQLLAHALLLQGVLDRESLSAGVWYVAIDFQLFALAVLIFAGVRRVPNFSREQAATTGKLVVSAGVAASLLVWNRLPELDNWALYFFGAYGLGMMASWAVQADRPHGWVALMAVLGAMALGVDFRERILVALVTSLGLVWALRRHWQAPALFAPLQWVGQSAYSIFLVHFPVCLLVNAVFSQLWPQSPGVNALGMLLAFVLSLAAGRTMYRWVERPSPAWRSAGYWQASFMGTGLVLIWIEM